MAHIKQVKIGENTYLLEPAVYAATAGTSAITAAITNFALDTGVVVNLKITTANAADATLNVNGTGPKAIRYNNENIAAGALKANRFYSLLYDGSYWQLLGELDTNTTYSAGTGIGISGTTISNTGVTGVKGSSESNYRTGDIDLTAANVGAYSTTEIDNRLKKYLSYAHYSNTNNSNSGKYYKININSTIRWMLNFTIKLYHYYRAYDLQISGYNYGSAHWYSPAAIVLGASTTDPIKVIFGYDSGSHLWIAIPAHNYTGIDVLNATNGHSQITDIENLFSIELVDEEPTTKQETIIAYRPWYRDEIIPIENGGTNATTASDARTNLGLGSIAVKANTDYLPVSYSNLDYSSTTTTNGVYPVSGQTLQSIIGSTSSTKVYGGAIQFGNVSASNNSYGAQLVVASASGATSAPHAYIRRITSDFVWGTWSTLLDNNNARTLLGVTDNSSNADVTSSDTNLITGRTLYYQLAKKDYAPIASPTFTGIPKSVTPSSSSDSKMIATKEYVDNAFAANDAMIFKGTIGSSDATVTALPATHNIGWTYRVITADEYAGIQCEIGDLIICVTNGTAADDSHWTVAQTNIDGAVIGPASSTANRLAIFSGATGKEIKDSGVTLNTSSGSTTKWLTEKGTWTTPTAANIGAAPSSHTHYELTTIGDKRNENTTPNTYSSRLIFQGLKRNSAIGAPYTDIYSYIVGLRGWNDSSGGNSHELAFNTNGIYRRQGATTEWGNWFHLLDSNNYTDYAVAKTAGVTAVTWDTTNKKLTYTINETAADVVTIDTIKTALALTKSDVGLGNVANSTYAGGTAVTLNNSSKASSTASFYAPTTGGTANTQALVGNGATAAPKWVDISPSITIGAGTGSAAPTVNVTVLGRSGTAQSITTASTSVYGVTKLNDGIASNSTSLAATANSALVAAKKVASSNSTSKLYLVGATSQSTTGVDSYSYQYTYTNNGLLSALKVGLNLNGTEKVHLEWNDTDQSIDFVFN